MTAVMETAPVARRRMLGAALVVASTAFFALAGVFTKAITADAWTIASWRGLVGFVVIAAYVLIRRYGLGHAGSLRLGWRGWLLAVVGALASLAFISSFKFTYVANVTIIYATVPFAAAGLEWLVRSEAISRRTMVTALVSLAGVALMVSGGAGGGHLFGDSLAVAMMLLSALYMVLIRTFTGTPAVWTGAVSALMLFVAGYFLIDFFAVSRADMMLMLLFGVSFAAAVILWIEGTRLIPAADSGLIGSAEVPLAILFAYVLLNELPPLASAVGGGVVLAAVAFHTAREFRAAEAPAG